MPPSLLASACILAAAHGVKAPSAEFALHDICMLTYVDPFDVELTVRHIESVVANETAALHKQQTQALKAYVATKYVAEPFIHMEPYEHDSSSKALAVSIQPDTPTDVQDVIP